MLWDSTDTDTSTSGNKRNAYLLNGKVNVRSWRHHRRLGQSQQAGRRCIPVLRTASWVTSTACPSAPSSGCHAAVKNQSAANYNFYNGATGEVNGTVDGNDPKGLQVGIRHSF